MIWPQLQKHLKNKTNKNIALTEGKNWIIKVKAKSSAVWFPCIFEGSDFYLSPHTDPPPESYHQAEDQPSVCWVPWE